MFNIVEYATKIGIKLTEEQETAILTTDKNVAVVAVPGSGKTAVFVLRIAKLIKSDNISPENILALTFSKSAATDMEHRFNKWFGDIIDTMPSFSTIHSFAYSILKDYDIEFDGNVIDETKKTAILRELFYKIYKECPTLDVLKNIGGKISYNKNLMLHPENIVDKPGEIPVQAIYKEYEIRKKVDGLYDFDDLLERALVVLTKSPDVLKHYQEQYKYIQIDEYQDTSRIQNAIIKKLYNNNNIFVVGDDDQSIYKFRGASPEDFLDFEKNFPNSKTLYLSKNFRSTKTIVNTATAFIAQNDNRFKKSVSSTRRVGAKISVMPTRNPFEQVDKVLELISSKTLTGTYAILYRNNMSAIPFINKIYSCKDNYSFSCYGTEEFFDNFVIRDMLAFLKLSQNFGDLDAFSCIYPKHYISKQLFLYVEKNISKTHDVFKSLIDGAIAFGLSEDKIDSFRNLRFKYVMLKEKRPVIAAIQFVEDDLDYLGYLEKNSNNLSFSVIKQNLSVMKIVANDFIHINDFIHRLNDLQEFMKKDNKNSDEKPTIYLKTIHSSKGLEWDNVFIVDLMADVFLSITSITEALDGNFEEIYEERRLFYVGMTRAKNRLFLLYPIENIDKKLVQQSLFLTELKEIAENGKSYALQDILDNKRTRKRNSNIKKEDSLSHSDNSLKNQSKASMQQSDIVKNYGKQTVINFNIGDVLIHKNKSLGKGTVVDIDTEKNILKVNFKGVVKTYALDYCLKLNLFTKEN